MNARWETMVTPPPTEFHFVVEVTRNDGKPPETDQKPEKQAENGGTEVKRRIPGITTV